MYSYAKREGWLEVFIAAICEIIVILYDLLSYLGYSSYI
jgi:hypothetical protein